MDPRRRSIVTAISAVGGIAISKGAFGMPSVLSPRVRPPGFGFVPGNVYSCKGPGFAVHDIDLSAAFDAQFATDLGSKEVFIDPNGSDANTGQQNLPLKTLAAALAKPNVGRIWVKPGIYTERFDVRASQATVGGGLRARPIRIEAWGGPNTVTWRAPGAQPAEMAWTSVGMLFQATPPGGQYVNFILFREDGREIPIPYFPTAAQANDAASGWSQDPITKTISLRHENRNISLPGEKSRLEIMYLRPNDNLVYGATTYLRHINFRGDNQLLVAPEGSFLPTLYAKNCTFQYLAYHNVSMLGATTFFQECLSENCLGGDGWNYHDDPATGAACVGLEVDCIGRNNGLPQYRDFDGGRDKQGSSGHENAVLCRVNGLYERNYGQAIADTGVSSKSWMVGTKMISSRGPNPINMTVQTGAGSLWAEGTVWLDNVQAADRTWPMGLWADGSANLHDCAFAGAIASIGGPGVIAEYDPLAP
ncbi:hypothetical protein U2261_10275 [Achromobacter xylosoxidans]|uniref:hypothetical protein n=2 Tax=Alcaligenes xylosoxydans xylosoxydans TaxID=85698 RepID=UPI002ACABA04|nr:hypothetical protein [Achromobacter xylosoxidans]MDZ5614993.1 hypothetical protein [Achromobacter xylosoxidans]MDZ5625803.1 hypothetical protein [Achromobacter xylosoxidans]MDZ5685370.1 hypothetical protein [Achromobacter xylosoxidans]